MRAVAAILSIGAFAIASLSAWLTHVISCIHHQQWLLLLVGALAAPVGVIHGAGIWFGWWPA